MIGQHKGVVQGYATLSRSALSKYKITSQNGSKQRQRSHTCFFKGGLFHMKSLNTSASFGNYQSSTTVITCFVSRNSQCPTEILSSAIRTNATHQIQSNKDIHNLEYSECMDFRNLNAVSLV